LPGSISALHKLRILDASHNCLSTLPDTFSHLTSLKSLRVSHNHICSICSGLLALPNLTDIFLADNPLVAGLSVVEARSAAEAHALLTILCSRAVSLGAKHVENVKMHDAVTCPSPAHRTEVDTGDGLGQLVQQTSVPDAGTHFGNDFKFVAGKEPQLAAESLRVGAQKQLEAVAEQGSTTLGDGCTISARTEHHMPGDCVSGAHAACADTTRSQLYASSALHKQRDIGQGACTAGTASARADHPIVPLSCGTVCSTPIVDSPLADAQSESISTASGRLEHRRAAENAIDPGKEACIEHQASNSASLSAELHVLATDIIDMANVPKQFEALTGSLLAHAARCSLDVRRPIRVIEKAKIKGAVQGRVAADIASATLTGNLGDADAALAQTSGTPTILMRDPLAAAPGVASLFKHSDAPSPLAAGTFKTAPESALLEAMPGVPAPLVTGISASTTSAADLLESSTAPATGASALASGKGKLEAVLGVPAPLVTGISAAPKSAAVLLEPSAASATIDTGGFALAAESATLEAMPGVPSSLKSAISATAATGAADPLEPSSAHAVLARGASVLAAGSAKLEGMPGVPEPLVTGISAAATNAAALLQLSASPATLARGPSALAMGSAKVEAVPGVSASRVAGSSVAATSAANLPDLSVAPATLGTGTAALAAGSAQLEAMPGVRASLKAAISEAAATGAADPLEPSSARAVLARRASVLAAGSAKLEGMPGVPEPLVTGISGAATNAAGLLEPSVAPATVITGAAASAAGSAKLEAMPVVPASLKTAISASATDAADTLDPSAVPATLARGVPTLAAGTAELGRPNEPASSKPGHLAAATSAVGFFELSGAPANLAGCSTGIPTPVTTEVMPMGVKSPEPQSLFPPIMLKESRAEATAQSEQGQAYVNSTLSQSNLPHTLEQRQLHFPNAEPGPSIVEQTSFQPSGSTNVASLQPSLLQATGATKSARFSFENQVDVGALHILPALTRNAYGVVAARSQPIPEEGLEQLAVQTSLAAPDLSDSEQVSSLCTGPLSSSLMRPTTLEVARSRALGDSNQVVPEPRPASGSRTSCVGQALQQQESANPCSPLDTVSKLSDRNILLAQAAPFVASMTDLHRTNVSSDSTALHMRGADANEAKPHQNQLMGGQQVLEQVRATIDTMSGGLASPSALPIEGLPSPMLDRAFVSTIKADKIAELCRGRQADAIDAGKAFGVMPIEAKVHACPLFIWHTDLYLHDQSDWMHATGTGYCGVT
jgi:hypothetical protein